MNAAIAQLAVVKVGFLRTFAGKFRHACDGFTFLFRLLYLLLYRFGYVRILVQEVIDFQFDEITYILVDCDTTGSHIGRTQFGLGLALEDRFFHIDGNGGNQSVADIGIVHVLVEELFNGTGDMLLESTLMRTSLSSMLAVDERVVFFSVLSGMSEGDFDIFPFQMDDRVKSGCRHVVVQKVYQTVARQNTVSVINDGKSRIEIRVVAQHCLDKFGFEAVIQE